MFVNVLLYIFICFLFFLRLFFALPRYMIRFAKINIDCGLHSDCTTGETKRKRLNACNPGRRTTQHFYPDGGWGWIVCGVAFLAHVLTTGFQLSYGLLLLYAIRHLGHEVNTEAG